MVTIAGVDRGLTVEAIKEMEVGQIVDYVAEFNRMHDQDGPGNDDVPTVRKATQADWDALMG